jgi:hypothetical protein
MLDAKRQPTISEHVVCDHDHAQVADPAARERRLPAAPLGRAGDLRWTFCGRGPCRELAAGSASLHADALDFLILS